jgi:hypothetical protein
MNSKDEKHYNAAYLVHKALQNIFNYTVLIHAMKTAKHYKLQ